MTFKIIDFGTIESPCGFPLVINNNLPPILYRFQILGLWPIIGQIFAVDMGGPHLNTPAGGDPLRISG